MTEKQIKNKKTFEWLYRGVVMLMLSLIIGGAVKWVPRVEKAVESRTFTSQEDKVITEQFMREWGKSDDLRKLREHVISPDVHMPKHSKDSNYVTRAEFEKFMKNMAIDNWNEKMAIDEMSKNTEEMKRMMNIILSNQDFN